MVQAHTLEIVKGRFPVELVNEVMVMGKKKITVAMMSQIDSHMIFNTFIIIFIGASFHDAFNV
jgi:uncharacterized membrane protein YqhA